jgi:hypothetical protein
MILEGLDKDYIKGLIQIILNKSHTDNRKKNIREYPDKLQICCPLCGDSSKSTGYNKKRGNLYFKNMMYICYNESTCSRSFVKFLDTFGIKMDMEKKIQMYEYIEKNIKITGSKNDVAVTKLDKLINIDELCEFFKDNKNRKLTNLSPLKFGSVVYNHVVNKRMIINHSDIYEGLFYHSERFKQPVMVFMNKSNNKVISMQVRNLLEGDKRYFKIYDFSEIHDMMYSDSSLDEQERISYNKLSHFFNIFNIDFTSTINMFEGYVDSLFMPNSIGQIGINTDVSFLLNEEGIDLRFVYDNDKSGFRKAEEMLKNGHKVFLWNKFLLDLLKKYKGNKAEMACKLSLGIKDFNKLAIKMKKPLTELFNFDQYFSSDNLDKLYFLDLVTLTKIKR